MGAIPIKDTLNSPLNKPQQEVQAKTLSLGEPVKPLSIKVDKTVNGSDGSKTTYTVSLEREFQSAEELKGILDALGYCERKGLWEQVKGMCRIS